MHFVGVDLAWGDNKPTGLAVLDDTGRLVHISAASTDETIVAALSPYTSGPCLVAIDAPLVVTNAVGNRPAEALLNRDFARFEAGAHPSNTGKREFAGGSTRGGRLAVALDLEIDPASTAKRRAIEVYPHPATVALFRLGRTLKYKQKPGRSLGRVRTELLQLMTHLEAAPDLDLDTPEWRALRTAVQDAARKVDVRKVEDQVDAVVCAYVALFASRRPTEVTTYGDLTTGYIVTPTLPEGHLPTPRGTEPEPTEPEPTEPVDPVLAYAELLPELQAATERYQDLVHTLLDDAGINYLTVTGRAKSAASFAAKAARTTDGRPVYDDPLTQITDQVGLRVIAYLQSDVAAVAELLADQLTVLDDRDMGEETAREGRFGYASRHLLVTAGDGFTVQVQIRTVLQHAWAEFEHDIRYKGAIPAEHASDLDRRFTLAAGLIELADKEFTAIRERLQSATVSTARDTDRRISAQDLASFLGRRYTDAGWSRTDHYDWISGLLLELGITSLAQLGTLLDSADAEGIEGRMAYKYPPGAVRRLDDALLLHFGDAYIALPGNAHRRPLLTARLEKLRG